VTGVWSGKRGGARSGLGRCREYQIETGEERLGLGGLRAGNFVPVMNGRQSGQGGVTVRRWSG